MLEPTNADLQNALFGGFWLKSHLMLISIFLNFVLEVGWPQCRWVTGVLCYEFDGCLIWGKHNHPGAWNDAKTSRCLQEKLLDGFDL